MLPTEELRTVWPRRSRLACRHGGYKKTYRRRVSPLRSPLGAALSALGIVYGDLGTSPLYTMQAIVQAVGHPTAQTSLGVLSLIFWALVITISIKYCALVMRADNHGEGGVLALMALIGANRLESRRVLVIMGLFGAALIYGDGIITPAISVLSALEGVNVATPALTPFVLPAAVVILLLLFAAQRRGTARIGQLFGPIMLVWFVCIAALGTRGVIQHPSVLAAADPRYGLRLLIESRWSGVAVLGGVFLAITGGEALYADMGHFGRTPIRGAWYGIVLPGAAAELCGPNRAADPGTRDSGESVLQVGSLLGGLPARSTRRCCHDHR